MAILSKVGIDDVVANLAGDIEPDPDARIITATCGGVRVSSVYVPNGRSLDNPPYTYKLSWLDRLRAHLDADTDTGQAVLVGSDFHRDDGDVYDPAKFAGATHVGEPERDRLTAIESWGLVDRFRAKHERCAVS